MLFLGASAKQEFQYVGNRTIIKPWTITLKFATKCIGQDAFDELGDFTEICGWNHIYNPDNHKFERVTRIEKPSNEIKPLYDKVDFMQMFKPPS